MAKQTELLRGWLLLCREETGDDGRRNGEWHLAWYDLFSTKKSALTFAKDANWTPPYRAVRGSIVTEEMP